MHTDDSRSVPSADELSREFGSTVYTFVDQPHLAESGATATRSGDRITDVSLLYWYFPDEAVREPRATLWDAVRTTREPQGSLAELTASHLEHLIRRVGARPEEMSLEEWMRWDPLPRVRDVGDTTVMVDGRILRAVTIAHPRFVGFGTVIGTSVVTIALPSEVVPSLELSLKSRSVR